MSHTASNERLEKKALSLLRSSMTFRGLVTPIFAKNCFKRNFINYDRTGHVCWGGWFCEVLCHSFTKILISLDETSLSLFFLRRLTVTTCRTKWRNRRCFAFKNTANIIFSLIADRFRKIDDDECFRFYSTWNPRLHSKMSFIIYFCSR